MRRLMVVVSFILAAMVLTGCGAGPFEPLFVTSTPGEAAQQQPAATATPFATETAIVIDISDTPEPTEDPSSDGDEGETGASDEPAGTPQPTRESISYEIEPGDTLIGIAAEYGVSVDDLMAANGIEDPNNIWAGQTLVIPGGTVPTPAPTTESTATPAEEQEQPAEEPTPSGLLNEELPSQVFLESISHDWQKLNNCGPTTVAMALSYFGESLTQFDTAPILKGGDQDKNVSPEDLARFLNSRGYPARIFINGDAETLRRLVANDIPVIAEQWLVREGDPLTGHYRLVRGYDDSAGVFIVNDSYLGPALNFSYAEFDTRWRGFNRLYIPVYRPEQEPLVREIIGADWDEQAMYERALGRLQDEVDSVGDLYAYFNIADVYLGLGRYEDAIAAYEQAMSFGLPERMLWYRFGPFEAYNAAGQYQETISLANAQLAAVSGLEEIHYYRGRAYEGLGQIEQARADYQAAVQFNARFEPAQDALASLQ